MDVKVIVLLLVIAVVLVYLVITPIGTRAGQPGDNHSVTLVKDDQYHINHALDALYLAREPGTNIICGFLNVESGRRNCTSYNVDIEDYAPFMRYFNRTDFKLPETPVKETTSGSIELNCDFYTGWAWYLKQQPHVLFGLNYNPYVMACAIDLAAILGDLEGLQNVANFVVGEKDNYIANVNDSALDWPLGKSMTSLAFAMLGAYKATENESYKQFFYDYYAAFQQRRSDVCYKQYLNGTETLFIGNNMIELDLTAYDTFGNESFKEDAFRCVRNLLPLRQENGLIPYIIGENPMRRTEFDAENDFVVVLRKICLYFNQYCNEAEQIKQASLRTFEAPYGYYSDLSNPWTDTKYFGAMLKMWMPVNDSYLTRDR